MEIPIEDFAELRVGMPLTWKETISDVLHGVINHSVRVEAVGYDWVVLRYLTGDYVVLITDNDIAELVIDIDDEEPKSETELTVKGVGPI